MNINYIHVHVPTYMYMYIHTHKLHFMYMYIIIWMVGQWMDGWNNRQQVGVMNQTDERQLTICDSNHGTTLSCKN